MLFMAELAISLSIAAAIRANGLDFAIIRNHGVCEKSSNNVGAQGGVVDVGHATSTRLRISGLLQSKSAATKKSGFSAVSM